MRHTYIEKCSLYLKFKSNRMFCIFFCLFFSKFGNLSWR